MSRKLKTRRRATTSGVTTSPCGDENGESVFQGVDTGPARQVRGALPAAATVTRRYRGRVASGSRSTVAAVLAVITLAPIAACSSTTTQPSRSATSAVLSASTSASASPTSATPTATSSTRTTHASKPRTTAIATKAPPATRHTMNPAPPQTRRTTTSPASTLICLASMSNPNPAQYSTTDVIARTGVAGASVTATAHYKTTDTTHTGLAASNGVADIPFRISRATIGYPVAVDVTVTGHGSSRSCSTSFTPQ
jgi:hypothetical protein